jgi:hypothetical protein
VRANSASDKRKKIGQMQRVGAVLHLARGRHSQWGDGAHHNWLLVLAAPSIYMRLAISLINRDMQSIGICQLDGCSNPALP